MSLDNIHLPEWVITNLYRNTLIGPIEPGLGKKVAEQLPLRYLGNNLRHIVLFVNEENTVFIPDQQLVFLTKMLEACKLNLADVAILNLAGITPSIALIKKQLQPEIMILFGAEPVFLGLPFSIPLFKILAHDNCRYIYAPSLDQLIRDTDESKILKSKLWVCLKALFGLGG
jgi:hypothetical protein